MSTFLPNPLSAPRMHSVGAKLFLILGMAVLMSIPAAFVDGLVDQRAGWHGASAVVPILHVPLADSYRSVTRSLKYITLFLGLVFLTYFLFEATTKKRLHPGQYALVGVVQVIFYLLLLSLAEIVGFDLAFLVAGLATVLLFTWNVGWVFHEPQYRRRAVLCFGPLYGFIYVLLRLQNYALLLGAVASFAAAAVAMYLTRNVDWYGDGMPQPAGAMPPQSTARPRERWLE